MPTDYTILSLPCPHCGETFLVLTELQNHHLAAHERPVPEEALHQVCLRLCLETAHGVEATP